MSTCWRIYHAFNSFQGQTSIRQWISRAVKSGSHLILQMGKSEVKSEIKYIAMCSVSIGAPCLAGFQSKTFLSPVRILERTFPLRTNGSNELSDWQNTYYGIKKNLFEITWGSGIKGIWYSSKIYEWLCRSFVCFLVLVSPAFSNWKVSSEFLRYACLLMVIWGHALFLTYLGVYVNGHILFRRSAYLPSTISFQVTSFLLNQPQAPNQHHVLFL